MINIDRNVDRGTQLRMLTARCYDDYCYYNHIGEPQRTKFVQDKTKHICNDEFIIPYLPVYLTTRCTLNCKKCNNLMPMFHEAPFDFSWVRTEKSLIQILSQVKEIIFLELVGGEPFLFNEFDRALDFVCSQEKIRQVVIVTNATVIPSESILHKLMNKKILIRISDYGYFDKMSRFIAKMEQFDINVRVQQDMKWNDPGNVEKRHRSREEVKKQYNMCEFSLKCKYLCEDMLFTCARAASLYKLGISNCDGDVIKITKNTSKDALKSFYLHDSGDICNYCDLCTPEGKVIPAAEQVEKRNNWRHSDYTVISNYELEHFKSCTKKYENTEPTNLK